MQRDDPQQLIRTACRITDSGLSRGRSGNASYRNGSSFVITPTAIPFAALATEDLARVAVDGESHTGGPRPSSEWPLHQAIYRHFPEARAVIHAHSDAATALACCGQEIPPFHYMIAMAGGDSIRCTPYALFGSQELSALAVKALTDRRACLLGNHGQLVWGTSLEQAFELAELVESLSRQYLLTLQNGGPKLLEPEQMQEVLKRFADYRPGSVSPEERA